MAHKFNLGFENSSAFGTRTVGPDGGLGFGYFCDSGICWLQNVPLQISQLLMSELPFFILAETSLKLFHCCLFSIFLPSAGNRRFVLTDIRHSSVLVCFWRYVSFNACCYHIIHCADVRSSVFPAGFKDVSKEVLMELFNCVQMSSVCRPGFWCIPDLWVHHFFVQ